MKKSILILLSAAIMLFTSCSKSDTPANNPATNEIVGTWQYKSVAGTINTPAGSGPMSCTNTSGTITLNTNGSYNLSAVSSTCNYSVAGMSIPLPLSLAASSGTYVRSGTTLTTTPSSGQVFTMTIQELTSTRMLLRLNQTITTGVTTDVTYTLEK
jgi:hypothetical protein